MASYSKVILLGNLTRDPELRYTPSGTAVASFSVAINHRYRSPNANENGKYREETSFIDVVAFGRQGETCAEYLSKGQPVLVDGRLSQRRWESQDGQKRNKLEVIANTVRFLPRGGEPRGFGRDFSEETPEDVSSSLPPEGGEEDIPF